MPFEVFTNDGTGTVSAGGTTAPAPGTVESWTVSVSRAFPAASATATPATAFYVADPALETEKILVTNISGITWTVTRGADSTTPVAHVTGFTVVQVAASQTFRGLRPVDWLNIVSLGADPTGSADCTAIINNALAGGGTVYMPVGTYKISSTLQMTGTGSRLWGASWGSSIIQPTSGFTPDASGGIISVTAANCEVAYHRILGGPSATFSSNAAVSAGIEVGGAAQYCAIHDISAYYINGYEIEIQASQTSFPLGAFLHTIQGFQHKQGIHLKGTGAQNFSMQAQITDVQHGQIGGDSLFIEDCNDVSVKGHNDSVTGASGGHALHIKGACSGLWIVNCDLGVFPGAGTAPVILIEDTTRTITGTVSVNGTTTITDSGGSFTSADIGRTVGTANVAVGTTIASITNATTAIMSAAAGGTSGPQNCTLSSSPLSCIEIGPGVAQQGSIGAQVTGGASLVTFHNMTFKNNQTHGFVHAGTGIPFAGGTIFGGVNGDVCHIADCVFNGNGQVGSGTNYDLNWTGAATGTIYRSRFSTPIGSGAGTVTNVANFTGGNVTFDDNILQVTGITVVNAFGTSPKFSRRNSSPVNPHGSFAVTLTTATPTTGKPFDAMYYITTGAGTCSCVISGGGGTVLIPASALGVLFIPAGITFTPTFSVALSSTVAQGL